MNIAKRAAEARDRHVGDAEYSGTPDDRDDTEITLKAFLKIWANGPIDSDVFVRGCGVLEQAADYTPEKVVHRIVLVTLMAWRESNQQ